MPNIEGVRRIKQVSRILVIAGLTVSIGTILLTIILQGAMVAPGMLIIMGLLLTGIGVLIWIAAWIIEGFAQPKE